MRQTAVVRTEPDGSVVCRPRTHDDIISQSAVILREVIHHLISLGIIDKDTHIVGSQPVVAVLVLTSGGDITEFNALQTGNTGDILVDTIFIGSDPNRVSVVQIEGTQRIVAKRCLVVLVVQELFPLFVPYVYHHQSVMVASQPEPVVLVNQYAPHLQIVWEIIDTLLGQIFFQ